MLGKLSQMFTKNLIMTKRKERKDERQFFIEIMSDQEFTALQQHPMVATWAGGALAPVTAPW